MNWPILPKHAVWAWFLVCVLVLLCSCSKKEPRYPEDHARFERITEAVKTLQQAYMAHDRETTKSLLLPLATLEEWEREIERDFDTYADIDLDLSIERIRIEGDQISVYVSWQGKWKQASNDEGVRARGHGVLHWSGTHVILLSGVGGDLPFGMADRQSMS